MVTPPATAVTTFVSATLEENVPVATPELFVVLPGWFTVFPVPDTLSVTVCPESGVLSERRAVTVTVERLPVLTGLVALTLEVEASTTFWAETVQLALAFTPSQVAVIAQFPAATPVTSPKALTVAIAVLFEAQLTTRFWRMLLPASLTVAVICCVASATTLMVLGESDTELTGV